MILRIIIILGILLSIFANATATAKAKAKEPFPKIIFQTWKNKEPPKKMAYWSETWRQYNPDYEYILWDDADNRRFVQEEFAWFLPTYDSYDVEIKRADAIRYMFLYKYGGIYADLDFECMKPFDTLLETYATYEIILGSMDSRGLWHSKNNIPNAIMISKPGAKFWIRLLENMQEKNAANSGRTEELTGPIVLKESIRWWDWQIKILAPDILYPISWSTNQEERVKSLRADPTLLTQVMKCKYPYAYAITYWTHSW
jgi:mannosyltransferase OCH1-like enzyme